MNALERLTAMINRELVDTCKSPESVSLAHDAFDEAEAELRKVSIPLVDESTPFPHFIWKGIRIHRIPGPNVID